MNKQSQNAPDLLELMSLWMERVFKRMFLGFIQKPLVWLLFVAMGAAIGFSVAYFQPSVSTSRAIIQVELLNVRTVTSSLNSLNVLIEEENLNELSVLLDLPQDQVAQIKRINTKALRNYPAEGVNVKKLPVEITVLSTSPELFEHLDKALLFFFKSSSGLSKAAERELKHLLQKAEVMKDFIADSASAIAPYDYLQASLNLIETEEKMAQYVDSAALIKGFTPRLQLDQKATATFAVLGALVGWLLFGLFVKGFKGFE